MINRIYRLTAPKVFGVEFEDMKTEDGVLLKPTYMSVCRADQRYYFGMRPAEVLRAKLPMALIHEAAAEVIYDPSGSFARGERVVMIPNVPPKGYSGGEIYENYAQGSSFLSSGSDGFLREYVCLPHDRIVSVGNVAGHIASCAELLSVCVHAVDRFLKISHSQRERIGVWGDGSVAYFLCVALKYMLPDSKIYVIGKSPSKLAYFSFLDGVYDAGEIPEDFSCCHAFECCGGEGSSFAIDDIIKYTMPQGTVLLMGVSENKVPILTRMVLEKGLVLVGSSRSGREDFVRAAEIMSQRQACHRLERVTEYWGEVRSTSDLHDVFDRSMTAEFKTSFRFNV